MCYPRGYPRGSFTSVRRLSLPAAFHLLFHFVSFPALGLCPVRKVRVVKLGTCWEPLDPDPVAGYQLVGQSDQHSGTQHTESENEQAPLVSPPPPNVCLFLVCRLSFVVCCVLFVASCLLLVACWLLVIVCCLLFGVWCLVFGVCCLFCCCLVGWFGLAGWCCCCCWWASPLAAL